MWRSVDWVSFAFQGGRARLTRLDLLGPLRALAGQALFIRDDGGQEPALEA